MDRSLGPVYFRSATAALVVFSIVSRESFASLSEWIKAFRSVAGDNTVLIIVGNKCDLPDRVVQIQEAKEWAAEQNLKLFTTSAKTGEGIVAMFRELAEELYRVKGTRGSVTTSPARNDVPQCC